MGKVLFPINISDDKFICFLQEMFSQHLKLSKVLLVTPLCKAGESLEMKNYRPVADFPILEKVFEKNMLNNLLCPL